MSCDCYHGNLKSGSNMKARLDPKILDPTKIWTLKCCCCKCGSKCSSYNEFLVPTPIFGSKKKLNLLIQSTPGVDCINRFNIFLGPHIGVGTRNSLYELHLDPQLHHQYFRIQIVVRPRISGSSLSFIFEPLLRLRW